MSGAFKTKAPPGVSKKLREVEERIEEIDLSLFQKAPAWAAHFARLHAALAPFEASWNRSLLQSWQGPEDTSFFPAAWMEFLEGQSIELLHRFDDELTPSSWQSELPELAELMGELEAASAVFSRAPSLRERVITTPGLSQKKRHEISVLVPFLESELAERPAEHLVDLGGGVGHLARHLIEATSIKVHSVDAQRTLQETGRSILREAWPEDQQNLLSFHNCLIHEQSQPELDQLFTEKSWSLGLHTCGPLAWHQFEKSRSCQALLNIACCYDRLDPTTDFARSDFARRSQLQLSTPAFFLATRGRKGKSLDAFRFQERVQSYRFALHILLKERGLSTGFLSVGNAAKILYRGSFAAYAQERCQRLGLPLAEKASELEHFYTDSQVQRVVRRLFLSDLLRARWGRPLETLILLDRALWLAERGWWVALLELFDRTESPRNVGLYAVQRAP